MPPMLNRLSWPWLLQSRIGTAFSNLLLDCFERKNINDIIIEFTVSAFVSLSTTFNFFTCWFFCAGWQANPPWTMLGHQRCRFEGSLSTRNPVAAQLKREFSDSGLMIIICVFVECKTSSLFLMRFYINIICHDLLFLSVQQSSNISILFNVFDLKKKTFVQIRNVGE